MKVYLLVEKSGHIVVGSQEYSNADKNLVTYANDHFDNWLIRADEADANHELFEVKNGAECLVASIKEVNIVG